MMKFRKHSLQLSERESTLVDLALNAGRDCFVAEFGKRARMRDNELTAFKTMMMNGREVPNIVLVIACYGLERLWWVENKRLDGIPELLARLERLCGYRRTGGEPPRTGRKTSTEI